MNGKFEAIHVNDYIEKITTQKSLKVEVVFGVRSKNCAGNGICMINSVNQGKEKETSFSKCRRVLAHMALSKEGVIKLYLPTDRVCKSLIRDMFGETELRIEECFRIPIKVANEWQLERDYIALGMYPILRTETSIIITFPKEQFKY